MPARGVGFSAGAASPGLAAFALALRLAGWPPWLGLGGGRRGLDRLDLGIGRRWARVGGRWGFVGLRFDPDGSHALAGDDHPLRSAVAAENPDHAAVAEAVHHLLEGAALEVEASGSSRTERSAPWAAALRMTSWVSLSLVIG